MAKSLYANNTELTNDKRFSFLTEDLVVGGSTFRVQSILGFQSLTSSSGQIVCIGEVGQERTEILRTSNSTAPSAAYKEVTLRDTLQFDHPQDTKVTIVDWNRAEFQWSATTTGTKSTLVAYPIQIQSDQNETLFVDATQSTGFYFVRFNESIGNTNSDWSDPIAFGGYDDNMVAAIKQRAVDSLGETIDGSVITHQFLNSSLWEARREFHNAEGKRPFRRKFNFVIGTALTGSFRIEAPTDLETPYTAENLYGVRIGANANMTYYDKKSWDFDFINKPHSALTTAYTVGARDLYVSSARDFLSSGVVSVEGTNVTYSDKSNSGGTLRISTQGSWNASAGSKVWQNVTYGLPTKFTVWADPQGSAYIYFNAVIDTAYTGLNIFADYYRTLVSYDSDFDALDEPEYDMYVHYLMAKIKHRRNKGSEDITKDPDYKLWQFKKQQALQKENLMSDIRLTPDLPNDLPWY
jgi:hypothetical protein